MEPSKFMTRKRTPLPLMLYGVYVYLCSNSLRRASRILEPVMQRSYEAIRQWVQRFAPLCDRFGVDRKLVSSIFVDETMIKVKGKQAWLWVAFEPGLGAFLAFRISYHPQSILDAYQFLKELRSKYGRKPILTDDADWYPEACKWARLEHHVYGQDLKNLIERMNQYVKDRLECFDDLFPCMKEGCDKKHINNWVRAFRFLHNHVRVNEEIGGPPLVYDDNLPKYQRFIDLLSKEVLT